MVSRVWPPSGRRSRPGAAGARRSAGGAAPAHRRRRRRGRTRGSFLSSRTLPGQVCARRRASARPSGVSSRPPQIVQQPRRPAAAGPPADRAAAAGERPRRPGGSTGPGGTCLPATSAARSRLVAATMRTSTRRSRVAAHPPHDAVLERAQQPRLQLQRQLADLVQEQRAAAGRARRRPACSAWAPVKAPRSCPNSSLSTRLGGTAPQSKTTNGPGARGLTLVDGVREHVLAGAGLAASG